METILRVLFLNCEMQQSCTLKQYYFQLYCYIRKTDLTVGWYKNIYWHLDCISLENSFLLGKRIAYYWVKNPLVESIIFQTTQRNRNLFKKQEVNKLRIYFCCILLQEQKSASSKWGIQKLIDHFQMLCIGLELACRESLQIQKAWTSLWWCSPCRSLHCKLVGTQYQENENVLLLWIGFATVCDPWNSAGVFCRMPNTSSKQTVCLWLVSLMFAYSSKAFTWWKRQHHIIVHPFKT